MFSEIVAVVLNVCCSFINKLAFIHNVFPIVHCYDVIPLMQ